MIKGGYYTVEATFVVTIVVVVLVAILYTGLYVHDMIMVENYSSVYIGLWARGTEEDSISENEFREKLTELFSGSLFLMDINAVETEDELLTKKITVNYSVPVSIGFVAKAWGCADANTFSFEVEKHKPAVIKWDADAVKTKEK
ncbi:MAG: hypothetical protein K5639_04385 [Eubacterium sp.]|nr:hypothetical protein [Eubacterium sp.]